MKHIAHTVLRYLYSPPVVILILGIIFAYYARSIGLLLDDHVNIFPAIVGDYSAHFRHTIYSHGFVRPLTLIYFYFIYTIYLHYPLSLHVSLVILHICNGFLMFRLLRKDFVLIERILLSILYVSFPFFTEQYGWLGASMGTIVNGIVFVSILISVSGLTLKKKVMIVSILHFIGICVYEQIFFLFIPIAYLCLSSQKIAPSNYKKVMTLICIASGSFAYLVIKTLILPTHQPDLIRVFPITKLLSVDGWSYLVTNSIVFRTHMNTLFSFNAFTSFWLSNSTEGLQLVMKNLIFVLMLLYALWVCIRQIPDGYRRMIRSSNLTPSSKLNTSSFWVILAFCLLLPMFFAQAASFPFRVLALPFFSMLVAWYLWIRKKNPGVAIVTYLGICVVCIFISINMLNRMDLQAKDDNRFFDIISRTLATEPKAPTNGAAMLYNIPHSTQSDFHYGNYLETCMLSYWCMEAALDLRTDKIDKVFVEFEKERTTSYSQYSLYKFYYDSRLKKLLFKGRE